jgi:peroxiredoxin
MAATSIMLPLGTQAPAFSLPDTTGRVVSIDDCTDASALLVAFICNHCPYVKHVAGALAEMARDLQFKGVAVVGINSNDPTAYPDDSPAEMVKEVARRGYSFPYLFDETQEVAASYSAACTPDFFLFDAERKLAYRGQMDDSRPGSGPPPDGRDLRAAVDAVLAGQPVSPDQKPSIGCGIKWRPGTAPR